MYPDILRILAPAFSVPCLLVSPCAAEITGSWHFTGARYEGRATSMQTLPTAGTVQISQTGDQYTISFQFPGSSPAVTVPLVASGGDYRAEVEADLPPYDVQRSVVIRDHGRDTLTINWVDAGYEQVSPYGGWPDMQKFSAISGALTKQPAPEPEQQAWEGVYLYNGHLFEADDTGDTFHENFQEDITIIAPQDGPVSVSWNDEDPEVLLPVYADGAFSYTWTSDEDEIIFENEEYLVRFTKDHETIKMRQLGGGRSVLIWFGQGSHELTVKAMDGRPAQGPFPSIMDAFAEVGLLTQETGPEGPPGDPLLDTDGDGVSDLLEYAFGLNPQVPDRAYLVEGSGTSGLPVSRLDRAVEPAVLRIEFVRRKNAEALGIAYQVQWSADLATWTVGGTEATSDVDGEWERVVVTAPAGFSSGFARLAVVGIRNG